MQQLEQVTREVVTWLKAKRIDYALIGGLAVSFRTIERFTKDIDLVIAVETDQQAERCVRELTGVGYRVQTLIEQTKQKRIATVRLAKAHREGVVVDLLFASSGIETEIIAAAEPIEVFEDLTIPVATLSGLLALKILSVDPIKRPQDAIDIRNLLAEATPGEVGEASRLLQLVHHRGYNRGKDLLAVLGCYLEPLD